MLISRRRCAYFSFMVGYVVLLIYSQLPKKPNSWKVLKDGIPRIDLKLLMLNLHMDNKTMSIESEYLINNSKCKIRKLDPYNPQVMHFHKPCKYEECRTLGLLTYIKKDNNTATLYVNESVIMDYTDGDVNCCYSVVTRGKKFQQSKAPDNNIDVSQCIRFKRNATMTNDFILVICKDDKNLEVYKNMHAVITVKKKIRKKLNQYKNKPQEHLSILIVGIDAVSHMSLVRSAPLTYSYLKKNDWVEFQGYNVIEHNTFPNLMAMLTGFHPSDSYKFCNPTKAGFLDMCDMIWYDYRRLGFVTAYAEDQTEIATFNFQKYGFGCEPTDYYFRPYVLASEYYLETVVIDGMCHCIGPETSGERIFNLARDFTFTFKDYPNFGLFWMNSYSHNKFDSVGKMDQKIVDFLADLNSTGILRNSLVIFMSDHGYNFIPETNIYAIWLEKRLPFLFMSVPRWFRLKYPNKYENMIMNSKGLVSAYDMYMTLQDTLILSGMNYTVKKSSACSKCKSLFEEVIKERSCEDAGIEDQWCSCGNYMTVPLNNLIVGEIANFLLLKIYEIQRMRKEHHLILCHKFRLDKILSAGISHTDYTLYENLPTFMVTFQTVPYAVFQGRVSINGDKQSLSFKLQRDMDRMDEHKQGWCIKDVVLKKYCDCIILN